MPSTLKEVNSNEKGDSAKEQQDGHNNKISSKGSNIEDDENIYATLSSACQWLYECTRDEPDDNPLKVMLSKAQFHYFEDAETSVTKGDVVNFLVGDMLCLSVLQAFMRLHRFPYFN